MDYEALLENMAEDEVKALTQYADEKLNDVFKSMLTDLFAEVPEDPVDFMISWLQRYQEKKAEDAEASEQQTSALPVFADAGPPGRGNRRRVGVSAEPVKLEDLNNAPFRVIDKSEDEQDQIRAAVKNNILFSSLDSDQEKVVIDAMEKKVFPKDSWIIQQGEDGNEFYVVQQGLCETYININGEPKMVKTYTHGESFGELALMYNCPRAASIKAASDSVTLWAMDRDTFRRVLMASTSQKRSKFEKFLERVPVLQTLDNYERAKVADALVESDYKEGQYIVVAGDTTDDRFFILAEGSAVATKVLDGQTEPTEVMKYGPGDYFGELALLTQAPRAANVVATSDSRVIALDRGAFERLLGPCIDILQRDKAKYAEIEQRITAK